MGVGKQQNRYYHTWVCFICFMRSLSYKTQSVRVQSEGLSPQTFSVLALFP